MEGPKMERRRTMTMSWDGLRDDDDDAFFESTDRLSSVNPLDLASSDSDDEDEFEECRRSFASAMSSASIKRLQSLDEVTQPTPNLLGDYDFWMADPGDLKERRKRLLQGMGLNSNKDLLKLTSAKVVRAISRKVDVDSQPDTGQDSQQQPPKAEPGESEESKDEPSSTPRAQILLVRSRSDGDILFFSADIKKRKEELIGCVSKQRLTRTSTGLITPSTGVRHHFTGDNNLSPKKARNNKPSVAHSGELSSGVASFFLIKNLDTGKEFIVKEYNEQGVWNKFSDLQTGKQLSMEEFEKTAGYSPVVKELMRRANVSQTNEDNRKLNAFSKSVRYSKKTGVALLKNIMGVANTMSGLIADKDIKEKENSSSPPELKANKNPNEWVKVHQTGKSYKEFTALHLSQEIQAHEGSIWTIKFSTDSHYLASAGEDRVIHLWEVQECDVMSTKSVPDDMNSVCGTPVHPMAGGSPTSSPVLGAASDRPPMAEIKPLPSEKKSKKKTSNKQKGNSIPDYVNVPETVFALSDKPVCSFTGHQDDVLDLSWSGSQLLLSSSMDKTVRLWDTEAKSCLKLFAHNDYVTCLQFNPVDADYFISGSLDGKVRIWSIPNRKVMDWKDLHEMVTAACYTPDSQGAIIGSHKGSCRRYTLEDCKIEFKDLIEFQPKKKAQAKKVTGFEFAPFNPAEVLVTSADSRIRIVDGPDVIQKFRGFRNTSSQISASFSPDGKYVICASEDSQVFIWKREEPKNPGSGKPRTTIETQAHEHFHCKDVSIAIPWPGSLKYEPPVVEMPSKKNTKRNLPPPYPASASPTREEGSVANSKRHLPPLPGKSNLSERSSSSLDDECAQSARMDSESQTDSGAGANGESFSSEGSSSMRYGDSSSIASGSARSPSWSSSWSFLDGGGSSQGGNTMQATAWGLVIVTASSGGEIRVYQNFGLPLKVKSPTTLF